jgi:hypothetical protein
MAQPGLNGTADARTATRWLPDLLMCVFLCCFVFTFCYISHEPTGLIGPCIFTRPHCWSFLLLCIALAHKRPWDLTGAAWTHCLPQRSRLNTL